MRTFLSRNEFPCSLTQQAESVIKELGEGCSIFPNVNPRLIPASREHPALGHTGWISAHGVTGNHLGIKCLSLYSMGSVLLPILQMFGTHKGSNPPQTQSREGPGLCKVWE